MTKQRYITRIYDKIRSKSPPNRATSPTCLHCDVTHLSLTTGVVALHIPSRRVGVREEHRQARKIVLPVIAGRVICYSRVYIWHILCINFASRYKKCVKNITLQWRHTERDGDSNHHCLLNRLFRRRSKKTSKLRVTGLCPLKWPVTRKMFPLDDVIMPKPSAELTPLLLDDAITLWKRCRSVVLTMMAPLLRYLTN